ncbi:Carboxypeptidase, partial [Durusdinium trenchii]
AELELAKARAAVVEAKAALAAAKASPEKIASGAEAAAPQGAEIDVGSALEPEVVGVVDFSSYSQAELRPAKLFYGPEGSAIFEVLDKMEDVKELGSTSLDTVIRSWFMSLYQFSAASQAGEPPPEMPEDFRRNVKEVGGALKPDDIATFLMDRDKGGDWRPCVRALADTEFAKIMQDSLSWDVIFTDDVVRTANITLVEGRTRIINFLAGPFKEAGFWSDAEADAAERLIQKDPRLQRVFSRINSVKNSIGENIRSASLGPILALVFFVAAICFFCNGLSLSSQQDLPQDLPLMGLEK